jgi:arylsulfatase
VIISQGGAFAGWSLFVSDRKAKYVYNFLGLQRFTVESTSEIPPGEHQVRMEFVYDGGGLAKGGIVTLYLDGTAVGEGRVEATVPMVFSGDETCDIGSDTASPVSPDYTPETSHFTGEVAWVQIDIDTAAENTDHLISPEERLQIAMARQ